MPNQLNADDGALTAVRQRADYTGAERDFSSLLRQRLAEVLEGKRDRLEILRKYPRQPDRVAVLCPPDGLPADELRAPVVERLTWDAIRFVQAETTGGPIAQLPAPGGGGVVEIQTFPTKFPHIVIERADLFRDGSVEADEITWTLHRVQNQRRQTQLNRVLDATNLLFEFVRLVR
jgi:hypothetical protein